MKTIERPRKAIYKEAEVDGSTETLQSLLAGSLREKTKAQDRILSVGESDEEVCRLINRHATRAGVLVVEFLQFEPGLDPMTLDATADADELPIDHLEHDESTEIVSGSLYVAVWKNHAAVVQSTTLRQKRFEEYLGWLLSKEGSEEGKEPGVLILFSNAPAVSVQDAAAKQGVKEITFGRSLNTTTTKKVPEGEEVHHDSEQLTGKQALDFVRTFGDILGVTGQFQRELRNVTEPENLKVRVTVGYKRGTNEDGAKVMKALAVASRDDDSPNHEITFDDGTVLKGDDLISSGSIEVETINRLAVWESVADSLAKWLKNMIRERTK